VDERERRYEVGGDGAPSLTYETPLGAAHERLARAASVVGEAGLGSSLVASLQGIAVWLEGFAEGSLVEVDYGTVAGLFSAEALADDHSARDVRSALDALAKGDVVRSSFHYGALTERWAAARSRDSLS
jgi:hypothetical protein